MTSHYFSAILTSMTAKLREGRSKITTSFTCEPEIHEWFRSAYAKRGQQSLILENFLRKIRKNPSLVHILDLLQKEKA